jgi:hypothetical protein
MKNYIERAIALAELNNWTLTEDRVRALAIFIQKQEQQVQQALADIVDNAK